MRLCNPSHTEETLFEMQRALEGAAVEALGIPIWFANANRQAHEIGDVSAWEQATADLEEQRVFFLHRIEAVVDELHGLENVVLGVATSMHRGNATRGDVPAIARQSARPLPGLIPRPAPRLPRSWVGGAGSVSLSVTSRDRLGVTRSPFLVSDRRPSVCWVGHTH